MPEVFGITALCTDCNGNERPCNTCDGEGYIVTEDDESDEQGEAA